VFAPLIPPQETGVDPSVILFNNNTNYGHVNVNACDVASVVQCCVPENADCAGPSYATTTITDFDGVVFFWDNWAGATYESFTIILAIRRVNSPSLVALIRHPP